MTRSRTRRDYDWIVFTSANGVRFTQARLDAMERDVRVFGNADIAAIGDATADAIRRELALHVDLCPDDFVAEALVRRAGRARPDRRAQVPAAPRRHRPPDPARAAEGQRGCGGARRRRSTKRSRPKSCRDALIAAIDASEVKWITFTSSSTVKNFVALLGDAYLDRLKHVKIASIGPITSQTVRELGLNPTIEAETYNVPGLVDAILKHS